MLLEPVSVTWLEAFLLETASVFEDCDTVDTLFFKAADDDAVDVFFISDLQFDVVSAEIPADDDDFERNDEFVSLFDEEVFFAVAVDAISTLLSSFMEAAILHAVELDRRIVEPVLFS